MTAHFSGLVQSIQWNMAGLNKFNGPKPPYCIHTIVGILSYRQNKSDFVDNKTVIYLFLFKCEVCTRNIKWGLFKRKSTRSSSTMFFGIAWNKLLSRLQLLSGKDHHLSTPMCRKQSRNALSFGVSWTFSVIE